MQSIQQSLKAAVAIVALSLPLAACSVDVNEEQPGGGAAVDVRSPAGNVSVRTEVDGNESGIPVYPGARLVRDGDNAESANVNIDTPLFGVKVVAAEYETADGPDAVASFYREAMKAHGAVTECRGEIEFRGPRSAPVCEADSSAKEVQLVTGTEDNQRMVVVKPRGTGAEFAVVHVRTRS